MTALASLAVSGCWKEPVIKAQTEEEFRESFAGVTRGMRALQARELDLALTDIVLVELGLFPPMLEADAPRNQADPFTEMFLLAFKADLNFGVEKSWRANRAGAVVRNAADIVDWHTAAEILSIAQEQRRNEYSAALSLRQKRRDQVASEIAAAEDVRVEQENQAQTAGYLRSIDILGPHFSYKQELFIREPQISFRITNNATWPISRVFMHGKLQTPGRAIPWVEADLNYTFPGGLEAGESQGLTLTPNILSDWKKMPEEHVSGASLYLDIVGFDDPAGKRFSLDPRKIERKKPI